MTGALPIGRGGAPPDLGSHGTGGHEPSNESTCRANRYVTGENTWIQPAYSRRKNAFSAATPVLLTRLRQGILGCLPQNREYDPRQNEEPQRSQCNRKATHTGQSSTKSRRRNQE